MLPICGETGRYPDAHRSDHVAVVRRRRETLIPVPPRPVGYCLMSFRSPRCRSTGKAILSAASTAVEPLSEKDMREPAARRTSRPPGTNSTGQSRASVRVLSTARESPRRSRELVPVNITPQRRDPIGVQLPISVDQVESVPATMTESLPGSARASGKDADMGVVESAKVGSVHLRRREPVLLPDGWTSRDRLSTGTQY